jgi:hypothetical protein
MRLLPSEAKLSEPPLHAAAPAISTAGVSHQPLGDARHYGVGKLPLIISSVSSPTVEGK